MEINNALQMYTASIKQAISMVNLKKAMNQDALTVSALLSGMQSATAKTLEYSIIPHKSGSIDISI